MKQGLRHIKAFLMVAELKNFGRAASQLYISPSTLTLQIQQLEEELGLKLFDRTKRSVHITPEGQQMILPLKAVLTEYEYALEFSQNISEHVLGSINIAVLPTIASSLLPLWIKEFKKEYPRVKIIVQDLNANEIHHAVKSGTADLGIGTVELSDPHLTFNRLFEDELRVFFHPDHELAAKKDIYLKDVLHFPQIVTMPGSSVYNTVKHAIENMGLTLENLDIACEVRYLSTAMGLIESNIGIAILPESTPINIKQIYIQKKKIIDFPDTRTIHMMRLKSAHDSLLLNNFIKVIYNNHKLF